MGTKERVAFSWVRRREKQKDVMKDVMLDSNVCCCSCKYTYAVCMFTCVRTRGGCTQSACAEVPRLCVRACAGARVFARSPSISMTSKRCANWAPGSSLESHLPILFKAGRRGKTQTNNKRGVIQERDRLLLCVCVTLVCFTASRRKYNEERGRDVWRIIEKESNSGSNREGKRASGANNRAQHHKGSVLVTVSPQPGSFWHSPSSCIPPCEADTKGEPIVCIIARSTGRKSRTLSALFRAKGCSLRCQQQFFMLKGHRGMKSRKKRSRGYARRRPLKT